MKNKLVLFLCFILCFTLVACSDESVEPTTEEGIFTLEETTTKLYDVEYFTTSDTGEKLHIEDFSAEYVEPDFRIVNTVEDCYNYFDTDDSDSVETERDSEDRISLITITDKSGKTKGTVKFKYSTDIAVTVKFFENGEASDRLVFSFIDEKTLSYVAHIVSSNDISMYVYNEDGSFKCYVDSAGFSSLLTGAVMNEFGGGLF